MTGPDLSSRGDGDLVREAKGDRELARKREKRDGLDRPAWVVFCLFFFVESSCVLSFV